MAPHFLERAPSIFFVCHEAKNEVCKHYKPVPSCGDVFPTIWVDFKVNLLCIRELEADDSWEGSQTGLALKHLQQIPDMCLGRVLLVPTQRTPTFVLFANGLPTAVDFIWPKTSNNVDLLRELNLKEIYFWQGLTSGAGDCALVEGIVERFSGG
jgi:hypothetical protein